MPLCIFHRKEINKEFQLCEDCMLDACLTTQANMGEPEVLYFQDEESAEAYRKSKQNPEDDEC